MSGAGTRLKLDFEVGVANLPGVGRLAFRDLLGAPTLVSVFLRCGTPTCDRQNQVLVACAARLAQRGLRVVGLSRDSVGALNRYALRAAIPYPLISDPTQAFAAAAGLLREKSLYGRTYWGADRSWTLLDRTGVVCGHIEKLNTETSPARLFTWLDALAPDAPACSVGVAD